MNLTMEEWRAERERLNEIVLTFPTRQYDDDAGHGRRHGFRRPGDPTAKRSIPSAA